MEKKGTSWMLLVGALLLASAAAAEEEKRVESVERFSTKLLAEAEKEVGRIVGLMHRSLDGNAKAQYELGTLILEEGPTYIRKNVSKEDGEGYYAAHREVDTAALKWMVRSARQGHTPAVSACFRSVPQDSQRPSSVRNHPEKIPRSSLCLGQGIVPHDGRGAGHLPQ